MQAKLPDINAAFVKYRTKALESISSKDYNAAASSLNNINALFPDDYRVKIDLREWEKAIKNQISYVCAECEKEIPFDNVVLESVQNDLVLQVISEQIDSQVWDCPECQFTNSIESTRIKKIKVEEPFYLGVVPPCPVRNQGLQNRLGFHQRFSKWFYKYLEEIEYQLGLYRMEYASEGDGEETVFEPED